MPRTARIVVPGVAHHVTQRGNNRADVFYSDEDRRMYLDFLRKSGEHHGLRVEGYCLMTNHVHVVAVPETEGSLAKGLGRTNLLYTQYVNERYVRDGRLWQNRFFSCPMGDGYRVRALCYVELNPVRAGMVKRPEEYPWSSAACHCGGHDPSNLLDFSAWRKEYPGDAWRQTLNTLTPEDRDALRHNTRTGRPLGDERFLDRLETALGRSVRPRPSGRPKGWRRGKDLK